jgi:hypothetical protein
LTFRDASSGNIDVLRSDDGGQHYAQIGVAIQPSDPSNAAEDSDRAAEIANNQHGNVVIDHLASGASHPLKAQPLTHPDPRDSGTPPDFYAYQAFVAPVPGGSKQSSLDEMFVSVSSDGGYTWKVRPIGCSAKGATLDHAFPIVSVDPAGRLWAAWSDDKDIITAMSSDQGASWTCSAPVSTTTSHGQAIYPWIVATSAGVDLVYYASPAPAPQSTSPLQSSSDAPQVFYVYFAQNLSGQEQDGALGGWGTPQQLFPVHKGVVCEDGASCTDNRQLFDDFGVDTDSSGWAHIAFSADANPISVTDPTNPNNGKFSLGASASGYAVQVSGARVGFPN